METLRFYRNNLRRLVRRLARDQRFEIILAVTPDAAAADTARSFAVRAIGQGSGDLGRRMIRALRTAGARPAVVVGSDIPELRPRHIALALRALGRAPVVLGPASDGGYWLIGARHPLQLRETALGGVRCSGPHALEDTVARLEGAAVLECVLDDVDDVGSYQLAKHKLLS